ncbi:uncharacterized protein [Palaemon carinicauda]|uniref:uncharacterized protein n=1 Tax=Palaemon carinicauda TaxID=392227 RepID=UPI0035B5A44A
MMESAFKICNLQDKNGRNHSALWIPEMLPSHFGCQNALPANVFNLVMIESSSGMTNHWPHVVSAWNEHVKDKLEGRTNVYTFGYFVELKRTEPELTQDDLQTCEKINFTNVIRTTRQRAKNTKETNIRIFIITKGPHEAGEPYPEEEISVLSPPDGKNINVYILGIGDEFPANYCLEILSKLNTGNKTDVTFFQAKDTSDIPKQFSKMGNTINPFGAKLELSIEGCILPGYPHKTSSVQLGEWVYFDEPQTELNSLALKVNDGEYIEIAGEMKSGNYRCSFIYLFLQWNKVLIQVKCKEKSIPDKVFSLMESFYSYCQDKYFRNISRKERKVRNSFKSYENQFRQCMKEMRAHTENIRIKKEEDLADLYLKTAAFHCDHRTMKRKFCDHKRFENAVKKFQTLYEMAKPRIMALPPPQPEYCCRITKSSTLSQLMEQDFEEIFQKKKFDFLKNFVMSGIPVFSTLIRAAQRNVWAIKIKHILIEPYSVMSQQSLEDFATFREECLETRCKAVQLEAENEKTKFNAVIPTIPANSASVLKPLVQSDLYAMVATFCILKNPNTVDSGAHFAALGCAWLKTLKDNPDESRPEFICNRLDDIVSTAKLYLDTPKIANFISALIAQPKQSLMFESKHEFLNKPIQCESLVKPVFLLFLIRESMSKDNMAKIFRFIVFEFLRRCIIRKDRCLLNTTPFIHYFCSQLSNTDERKSWIEDHCKATISKIKEKYGNLVDTFYTLQDLRCSAKKEVLGGLCAIGGNLLRGVPIDICMKRVLSLKSQYLCGEITWSMFEILSRELGIPFYRPDKNEALLFVTAILNEKEAKKQLPDIPSSSDNALSIIKRKILTEVLTELRKGACREWRLTKEIEEEWKKEFKHIHSSLAIPLTPEQIVAKAQERGVAVTRETFHDVYKYDDYTMLLRNACQNQACPHYLKPRKDFSQHLSQLKALNNCPESLHRIIRKYGHQGVDQVNQELLSGERFLRGKHRTKRKKSEPFQLSEELLQALRGMYTTTGEV